MKQEMMGWQWHQLDHMQIICTSMQTDRQPALASTPSQKLEDFVGAKFYCPQALADGN